MNKEQEKTAYKNEETKYHIILLCSTKNVIRNSANLFIMKLSNKRELKHIGINYSSNSDV